MLVQRVQGHFRTKALRFLRRSARSSCSISRCPTWTGSKRQHWSVNGSVLAKRRLSSPRRFIVRGGHL